MTRLIIEQPWLHRVCQKLECLLLPRHHLNFNFTLNSTDYTKHVFNMSKNISIQKLSYQTPLRSLMQEWDAYSLLPQYIQVLLVIFSLNLPPGQLSPVCLRLYLCFTLQVPEEEDQQNLNHSDNLIKYLIPIMRLIIFVYTAKVMQFLIKKNYKNIYTYFFFLGVSLMSLTIYSVFQICPIIHFDLFPNRDMKIKAKIASFIVVTETFYCAMALPLPTHPINASKLGSYFFPQPSATQCSISEEYSKISIFNIQYQYQYSKRPSAQQRAPRQNIVCINNIRIKQMAAACTKYLFLSKKFSKTNFKLIVFLLQF